MPMLWNKIDAPSGPSGRSLHAGAVVRDSLYIFGGYDGSSRLGDLHAYNFASQNWRKIDGGIFPSARDRFTTVGFRDGFWMFGGFDGSSRVNDLWRFDTVSDVWIDMTIPGPSARHSHNMLVAEDGKLFVLFGYDGSYKNDVWEYTIARKMWVKIEPVGDTLPRPRYRCACILMGRRIFAFGGHDGHKHLDDVWEFDLDDRVWREIHTGGSRGPSPPFGRRSVLAGPPARDSHSAVAHGNRIFVFGGSSGGHPTDELWEFRVDRKMWLEVGGDYNSERPQGRFCHVSCTHGDSMYVHAGYDGQSRLCDFWEYSFLENSVLELSPPSLIGDMRDLLVSGRFSDISFRIADETVIPAHRAIVVRSPYFSALFESGLREMQSGEVEIRDMSPHVFRAVLEYLYTDEVDLGFAPGIDLLVDVLVAADRFGIDRLKRICEFSIFEVICTDNACAILRIADMHNSPGLRKRALEFIKRHFDEVVKSEEFEALARTHVELALELIRHK
jgi:leucine-zipper-like transcriptional regulator 1